MRIPQNVAPDLDLSKVGSKDWNEAFRRIPAPLDAQTYARIAKIVEGMSGVCAIDVRAFRSIDVYSHEETEFGEFYKVRSEAIDWESPKEEVIPVKGGWQRLVKKDDAVATIKRLEQKIEGIRARNQQRMKRAVERMPFFRGGIEEAQAYFKRPVMPLFDYRGGSQFISDTSVPRLVAFMYGADALINYNSSYSRYDVATMVAIDRKAEQ